MAALNLIGRDDDLAELQRSLHEAGLVTVLGPGGVGKTAVARALLAERDHLFVELSPLSGEDDLGQTVAGRLGFSTLDGLLAWLADEPTMVVLDTCEHVLDGAAELIRQIAATAPATSVLATSRMPLDLPDEHLHVLRPLGLSTDGDPVTSPAVQLFVARSTSAGAAAVEPDPEAVARLCARLDGMPLAIELAAARSRSMSPDEIVAHLDEQAEVLSRPSFRGEARHRSMRAAIDWSYRLLDDEDQARLRALAVFPGWFGPELAAAVWAAPETGSGSPSPSPSLARSPSFETHDLLADLVDQSLVVASTDAGQTRFRLLDTIRAYARQQAAEAGDLDTLTDRYVQAVADLAQGFLAEGGTDWTGGILRRLMAITDDLLQATRQALVDPTPDRAYGLLTLLWAVVHQGRPAEIAQLGLRVLDTWPGRAHPMWADAAATTATALRERGDNEQALALATEAEARMDGALFAPITVNRLLALIARNTEPATALDYATAARAAAEALGLTPFAQEMEVFQAQALFGLGRPDEALARTRTVLDGTDPDDVNNIWARIVEGMVLLTSDPSAGVAALEEASSRSAEVYYPFGMGASARLLALADIRQGHHRRAAERLLAAIAHNLEYGNVGELGVTMLAAASLLETVGAPEAEALAGAASTWHGPALALGPELDDLLIADANVGRAVPSKVDIDLTRAGLLRLVESVGPTDGAEPNGSGRGPEPDAERGGSGERRGPTPDSSGVLRRQGDHWQATYAGHTVTLRHAKGLVDLATLIERAGTEIHVLDLTGAAVVEAEADTVIDDTAIVAYRDRVIELEAELDEADANADPVRAERAQVELDQLIEQLSAAYGTAGRRRRTTGSAERARSTVTQRLRSTIKRIGDHHPELGRHLTASVSTGLYCSYRPERPVTWDLTGPENSGSPRSPF